MLLKFSAARMGIGAACLVLASISPLRAEPVFDGLAGAWSGIGTMKPSA
jgi:hypothetical protein